MDFLARKVIHARGLRSVLDLDLARRRLRISEKYVLRRIEYPSLKARPLFETREIGLGFDESCLHQIIGWRVVPAKRYRERAQIGDRADQTCFRPIAIGLHDEQPCDP